MHQHTLGVSFLLAAPALVTTCPCLGQFVEPDVRVIHEIRGEAEGDQFGWIGRRVGDVDGDTVADVVISAPFKTLDGENAGRVYVHSGASGKRLWSRDGEAGWYLGLSIQAAGDVNGDGVGDVIAGAVGGGSALVLSGRDGSTIHHLRRQEAGEAFGRSVGPAGDVDGDGRCDLLVGAPRNAAAGEQAGRVYVIGGADGAVLRSFDGEAAGDNFGSTLGGHADERHSLVVVGAMNAGEGDRGRVYVHDGRAGTRRFTIDADSTGVNLGRMFVSVVGDVNGDGVPDVYASDWENAASGEQTGRIYVHSGTDGARLLTLTGEAAGEGFGIGPADAGDVDGDGHDDLIVGAWQDGSGATGGGGATLFSGRDGARLRTITSTVEQETFGFDATGLGDVDGDGAVDFLITSGWSNVGGPKTGRVFIIAGVAAPAASSRPAATSRPAAPSPGSS